jgi:hypothetical protein
MKKILFMLILLLAGCAAYRSIPPGETTIVTNMEVPGMSKEEIFSKSKTWMESHLYSKGEIIRGADGRTGVIVANGNIDYPAVGKLEEMERIQYTITFDIKEEINNSLVTLTFYNLLLDIPKSYNIHWNTLFLPEYTGGYSVPIQRQQDFDAAKRGALGIAGKLEECLTRNRCE